MNKSKHIGVLTSGGDCPGLNAVIRAIGKASQDGMGMSLVGFRDGFRGLVFDKAEALDSMSLSGIISVGGTILGTSRDKPHRMPVGGKELDMSDAIVENYKRHHLDALICIGGGGTQKNALRLKEIGLNVITVPKTIDNDIPQTDSSIGFDTALGIATEAIDRLHSTAMSHQRIIVVELMGHRAGWLALGAGMAGGADVILLPEIPYDIRKVANETNKRKLKGKRFSIIAVAEGAMSVEDAERIRKIVKRKDESESKDEKRRMATILEEFHK
nr:ATP-dependent 6-phosphofructokinase [Victivallales bacterium]